MPKQGGKFDKVWPGIAAEQEGIVSRAQLLAADVTEGAARREIVARRWNRIHDGVYATFTGTPSDRALIWAAVLRGGTAAVASHRTALWLAGALDQRPRVIEGAIPHHRQAFKGANLRFYRMRGLADLVHPAATPPRLRLEPALLAATHSADNGESVLDLVLRCTQRRLTTTARLERALKEWPRHRWRSLLAELLIEAGDGVASPLELRYARDVERAHGLPRGRRNRPELIGGRPGYRDVRYDRYATVVELDGRATHPDDEAFRDLRRDNLVTVAGDRVLRYGWRDVVARACLAAAQVAAVLAQAGWPGTPRPCGPGCRLSGSG